MNDDDPSRRPVSLEYAGPGLAAGRSVRFWLAYAVGVLLGFPTSWLVELIVWGQTLGRWIDCIKLMSTALAVGVLVLFQSIDRQPLRRTSLAGFSFGLLVGGVGIDIVMKLREYLHF
ncbi:MAG: hypothetical protein QM770_23615 [Tepidisphaeraceae bacterium]